MPMPLSATTSFNLPSSRAAETLISPRSVNFAALLRTFTNACDNRKGSASRYTGDSVCVIVSVWRASSICGRTAETLERTVAELRAVQPDALGVVADVTRPGEVERFVEESAAALGGVDLLVANVGGTAGQELVASTPEDWL